MLKNLEILGVTIGNNDLDWEFKSYHQVQINETLEETKEMAK